MVWAHTAKWALNDTAVDGGRWCVAGGRGSADSLSFHVCRGNRRDMGVCVPSRDPAAVAFPSSPASSSPRLRWQVCWRLLEALPEGERRGAAKRWANGIEKKGQKEKGDMRWTLALRASQREGVAGERRETFLYWLRFLNGLCLVYEAH